MKTIIAVVLAGALGYGCGAGGSATAEYNFANLYHYPMDANGVVCYYYANVPGSLACVKVGP